MICEECCYEPLPVPPAGVEPEVLGWVVTDMNGDFYFAVNRQTPDDTPLVDRIHVTRLQAEVDHWSKLWGKAISAGAGLEEERNALQSELTKAREVEFNIRQAIADRESYLQDPELLQGNRGKYEHEVGLLKCFLSNQFAPVNKAPPLIQALHANGDLIAMEATIAQQAQRIADLEADKGQGEPAKPYGYMFHPDGKKDQEFFIYEAPTDRVPDHNGECWTATPLYAEQPAPVAVVMPELVPTFEAWWESDGQYCRAGGGDYEKTFAYRAYENAIAETARLNPIKQ